MFIIAILATFTAALVAGLVLTPLVRRIATRRGFVDRPDGRRKIQQAPVALGGGSAVLGAVLIGVMVLCGLWLANDINEIENLKPLAGLFVAATLICVVGLVDDYIGLRGRTKLLWQLIAAAIVVFAGPRLEQMSLLGSELDVGHFGAVIAMFWLLASINSLNLIDGADGLATTVGVIFGFTVGAMALIMGHELDAVIAFILAGALLGFLRYNFAPATIYLGDAGSMIIGLILGALTLRCSNKEAATMAFAAPLAIWAIPMLDSLAAIARRKLTGRSIYTTDRGHIHHRLLTQGLSTRKAVGLIAGLCTLTSVGSVAGMYFANDWIGIVVVLVVVVLLISTRVFGHVELMLLNRQLLGIGRSIVSGGANQTTQSTHRLQGSLQWEEKIWNALVESAERFKLTQIRLSLYLPHLHEDFYATWRRRAAGPALKTWRIELPLVADDMVIGSLHVTGNQDPKAASAHVATFLDFIEPLEAQIGELLAMRRTPLTPPAEPDGLEQSADSPADAKAPLADDLVIIPSARTTALESMAR